ncbi:MAG TPA: glycerate kinase [Candidatus Ornithospirochaeta stercorigallinarum]|nr:glycerate kinase [Candidatus Ornithospirochaeta stercorigallinarum]
MRKVILIPDSFKGTMSSSDICQIMRSVILEHYPDCEVVSIPVADGGEGSVDAFLDAVGGKKVYKEVTGPYPGEKVQGYYGILPDNVAVIEMAAAAALPMVGERKNPAKTTTYGVGELMIDAARKGVRKIILGLGGSATNDAACGLASACGISFYNAKGEKFTPLGESMDEVVRIDTSTMDEELKKIEIVTMCDIDNPFYGPEGAPAIYGPQKGADEEMVKVLDQKMRVLSEVMKRDCGVDVQSIPGSGAAGGMGGGMAAYFKSKLQMGIETVLETVHFDDLLEGTDFVYTGEGKIDGQSLRGKVVIGVARKAKAKGVKVIAIVGDIGDDIENAYKEGVTGIFSTNRVAVPYKEARPRAKSDLRLTVDNLLRYQKAIIG